MEKKQARELYNKGELKAVAVIGLTNTLGIEILEIEHGINDYCLGVMGGKDFFKKKIYHTENDSFIKFGNNKLFLSEMIRVS